MEATQAIGEYLVKMKDDLKLNELFVVECSNGFVLASTLGNRPFDTESLGSLISGDITAMELCIELFNAAKIEQQIIETKDAKFMLQRLEANYFLLVCAGIDTRTGFLRMKIGKKLSDLRGLIAEFIEQNKVNVSELDIDSLTATLDENFDQLFTKS